MGLAEVLQDDTKKAEIIKECAVLVDDEVKNKSGISGFAVKTGYGAVKGVKPGFIQSVLNKLLPHWAAKMDPIWSEGVKEGNPVAYFEKNKGRVAEALLAVTDERIADSSGVVKKTYSTLRGSAKKNVEEAVPRLALLMKKHAAG